MKIRSMQTPCGPDMLIPLGSDKLDPQASDDRLKIIGPWHGSTVLLVRLPSELLVAVDSFACATYKDVDEKSENKTYMGLMSHMEEKFVRVIGSIHAAFIGNGDKCWKMIHYLREEMMYRLVRGFVLNIDHAAVAAHHYFKNIAPCGPGDVKCAVYLCCWVPEIHRHKVFEVGDYRDDLYEVEEDIFGAGHGSEMAVTDLHELNTPVNVDIMKDKLIKITLRCRFTGGLLKVFSLGKGTYELKYEGSVLNELDNRVCANELFDHKSAFVIILKEHEYIMSRNVFERELKRFGAGISVYWLCIIDRIFLLYRVVFRETKFWEKWFNSCQVFQGSVRRGKFERSRHACHYYICDATRKEIEFFTKDMTRDVNARNFWKDNLTI